MVARENIVTEGASIANIAAERKSRASCWAKDAERSSSE